LDAFGPAWLGAIAAPTERAGPIDVELAAAGSLYVPIAAYPGWSARLDGAFAPLRPDARFGMWVDAPAGAHRLELRFTPAALYAGAAVSAATLLGVVVLLARVRHAAHREQ
jgi:uncharacterized membrane protein YfhO